MADATPEQIAAAFDAGTLTVDTPGLNAVSGAWGAYTYFATQFLYDVTTAIQNAADVAESLT